MIICDLNKTPDLFQESPQKCPKYGNPVDSHYCQGCALLRKKFKEDLFTYCIKNGVLQDSSEPSNENINVVNALQEPFVFEQDPSENSSQNGNSFTYDSTSDLVHDSPNNFNPPSQPPFYSCEFCGNDARYGHYCTPQIPVPHEAYQCQPMNEDYYHEQNSCYDINSFGFDQFQPSQYTINHPIFNAQNDLFNSQNKLIEQLTSMYDMIPVCYDDDDEEYTIAVTHILSTKEPNNSLSMGDEHLDTIPAMESNEFIKSSVENLVPIPTLKDNPTPSFDFMTKSSSTSLNSLFEETNTFDNSLPEFENFCFDLEEISSGSTTTHSDISILEYVAFYDDHVKENSSGSTTTHSDYSLYD
nr:hypothetical protein [Tanacetum cinerariifolium]